MVKAMLMPAPGQAMGHGVTALLEQLERHCLAPDGSLASKAAYLDLVQVFVHAPSSSSLTSSAGF